MPGGQLNVDAAAMKRMYRLGHVWAAWKPLGIAAA